MSALQHDGRNAVIRLVAVHALVARIFARQSSGETILMTPIESQLDRTCARIVPMTAATLLYRVRPTTHGRVLLTFLDCRFEDRRTLAGSSCGLWRMHARGHCLFVPFGTSEGLFEIASQIGLRIGRGRRSKLIRRVASVSRSDERKYLP